MVMLVYSAGEPDGFEPLRFSSSRFEIVIYGLLVGGHTTANDAGKLAARWSCSEQELSHCNVG
jgi:hypothetical protein